MSFRPTGRVCVCSSDLCNSYMFMKKKGAKDKDDKKVTGSTDKEGSSATLKKEDRPKNCASLGKMAQFISIVLMFIVKALQ